MTYDLYQMEYNPWIILWKYVETSHFGFSSRFYWYNLNDAWFGIKTNTYYVLRINVIKSYTCICITIVNHSLICVGGTNLSIFSSWITLLSILKKNELATQTNMLSGKSFFLFWEDLRTKGCHIFCLSLLFLKC